MFKANQALVKPEGLQKILVWGIIIHIKQQLLFNIVSFANHTVDQECAILLPKFPALQFLYWSKNVSAPR